MGPFPISVTSDAMRGRDLRVSEYLPRGSVVLRCLPLVMVPADTQLGLRCASCLTKAPLTPCRHACDYSICEYCKAQGRWDSVHMAGECVSLRHLWTLIGRRATGSESGAADATNSDSGGVRMLIRLAYVRCTPLEAPATCLEGDALCDQPDSVTELLSHFEDLSEEQAEQAISMADMAKWCLLPCARMGRAALAEEAARLWCNSFDIVEAESGKSIGEALYPSIALAVNHSCTPNADFHWEEGNAGAMALRTLSPIDKGEIVSIPYCCLFTPAAARRKHLKETYFFTCCCARCERGEGAPDVPGLARQASLLAEALVAGADSEARAAAALASVASAAALENAVAPLVAAGADWARMVLARAQWWRLQASWSAVDAEALVAELSWLLGNRHRFTQRVLSRCRA